MAKKILVVEYNQLIVQMVREALEEEGYLVITSTEADDGLKKVRREQPNLVMVDFHLPDMTGNDFCKRIRRDPATNHVRILMLAEESQLEDLVIGPGASADDFLIKPFGAWN